VYAGPAGLWFARAVFGGAWRVSGRGVQKAAHMVLSAERLVELSRFHLLT
jgi:hypothetical protein